MSGSEAEILSKSVISKVSALRAEKGMSQYRLAELSGLSRESIRLIEKGDNSPTLVNLIRIAKALNLSLSDVFSELDL